MSFDGLAPHYRWMEALLAGGKLQRCRTAFLTRIDPPRQVLLLGEGNGRFLEALLAEHPGARVTCVDASVAMLDRARARVGDHANVSFVHADALAWSPPCAQFDLVVSHFFLDCFAPEQINRLAGVISAAVTSDANWLLADFRLPPSGVARWRAKGIVRLLYAFFRRVTGLSGSAIVPPDGILPPHGFELRDRIVTDWGLLHADWWVRRPTPSC